MCPSCFWWYMISFGGQIIGTCVWKSTVGSWLCIIRQDILVLPKFPPSPTKTQGQSDAGSKSLKRSVKLSEQTPFPLSTSTSRRLLIRYFRRVEHEMQWSYAPVVSSGRFPSDGRIKLRAVARGKLSRFFVSSFVPSSCVLSLTTLFSVYLFHACVLYSRPIYVKITNTGTFLCVFCFHSQLSRVSPHAVL